jgi:hypothetical protein
VLIRCSRCNALYTLQDLGGPARAVSAECGRCHLVFTALPEGAPTPRIATPARLVIPARAPLPRPPGPPAAWEIQKGPGEIAEALRPRRPAIYGPEKRRSPLTKGGAMSLGAVLLTAGAIAFWVNEQRLPREAAKKAQQARQELLLDDDQSLSQAAALLAEAARLAPRDASLEADRAFALLLRASARQDLANRFENAAHADPAVAKERDTDLRDATRLLREGMAAARAALAEAPLDPAPLRAMALASALTRGDAQRFLDAASRAAPGDALVTYATAAADLASGRSGDQQERGLEALAAASKAEPNLLRASVDAAAVALDKGERAAARQALEKVLQTNPHHERARRLLFLATR